MGEMDRDASRTREKRTITSRKSLVMVEDVGGESFLLDFRSRENLVLGRDEGSISPEKLRPGEG